MCNVTWTIAKPCGAWTCAPGPGRASWRSDRRRTARPTVRYVPDSDVRPAIAPLCAKGPSSDRVDLTGQARPAAATSASYAACPPRRSTAAGRHVGRFGAQAVRQGRHRARAGRRRLRRTGEFRARHEQPGSPGEDLRMADHQRPAKAWSLIVCQARTIVSGPMPAGSPIVMAMRGRAAGVVFIRIF